MELNPSRPDYLWDTISRMTGLHALEIPLLCPTTFPNVRFPRLTYLHLSLTGCDLDTVLTHCRYFFRVCPLLRSCRLGLPCCNSFPGIEDVIAEAIQHVPTLRDFHIKYKYPSECLDPLAELRRREFHWLRVSIRVRGTGFLDYGRAIFVKLRTIYCGIKV